MRRLRYSRGHANPPSLRHHRSARCRSLGRLPRPERHRHPRSGARRAGRRRARHRARQSSARRPHAGWLGRIRQPAQAHRHAAAGQRPGLPESLSRPGRGRNVPRTVAGGARQTRRLAGVPCRLVGFGEKHRPALRRAECPSGLGRDRRRLDRRCTGAVARYRQVAAGRLRYADGHSRRQGRVAVRSALGADREGRRRMAARGDALRRTRAAGRGVRAGQRLRRLRRIAARPRPES